MLKEKCPEPNPRLRDSGREANKSRIPSKALMYVTGFERGVRPMGDWSTNTTSSIYSAPSTRFHAVATGPEPLFGCCACDRARDSTSCSNVDFPEPETPVIATNILKGTTRSIFFRLCARAPRILICCVPGLRRVPGIWMRKSLARYRPVSEAGEPLI